MKQKKEEKIPKGPNIVSNRVCLFSINWLILIIVNDQFIFINYVYCVLWCINQKKKKSLGFIGNEFEKAEQEKKKSLKINDFIRNGNE